MIYANPESSLASDKQKGTLVFIQISLSEDLFWSNLLVNHLMEGEFVRGAFVDRMIVSAASDYSLFQERIVFLDLEDYAWNEILMNIVDVIIDYTTIHLPN